MAITVGVGKYNGEKRMALELEIFNLNAEKYHIYVLFNHKTVKPGNYNCDSANVYLIHCQKCAKALYIGDIFNVSPFTLMKGTGVPENYVF